MFGWKGDALQRAMDARCSVNCPELKTQDYSVANQCIRKVEVDEVVDGCESSAISRDLTSQLMCIQGLDELPGGLPITYE